MSFPSDAALKSHLTHIASRNPYELLSEEKSTPYAHNLLGGGRNLRALPPRHFPHTESKVAQAGKRTFHELNRVSLPIASTRIMGPPVYSASRRSIAQTIPEKAFLLARNIYCYAPRVNGEIGELAYQLRQLRSDGEKAFLHRVFMQISNPGSEPAKMVHRLAEEARSEGLNKRFSDSVLELLETNDLSSLTALLYDYFHKQNSSYTFPISARLESVVERPFASKYPWLLFHREPEMVKYLLEHPSDENFTHLTRLFQNMPTNGTSPQSIYSSYKCLLDFLSFCPGAPAICPMEKLNYYRLARNTIGDAIARLAVPGQHSIFIDIQNEIKKIFIWDPSHAFTTEIREGAPSGYHVLNSTDVHHFEDKMVLLNDPVIHERGIHIAFYEVQFPDSKGSFKRSMKYSSFYSNMNPEKLAEGLDQVLSNPINNPAQMVRPNQTIYFGFHRDLRGESILSQIYINLSSEGIPFIGSCFPVPYRNMGGDESTPLSPPRILRRSRNSGLIVGSPLRGSHFSPAKRLKAEAIKKVSPARTKIPNPAKRSEEIENKLARMIARLPFTKIPACPSSNNLLFSFPYSWIRGETSIRDLLLRAVNQVPSPTMTDQLLRPIRPQDTPDSYADVPVIMIVPYSVLRRYVQDTVE